MNRAGGTPIPRSPLLHEPRAQRHALPRGQPGVALSEVYQTVATSMWDAGFSTYNRGHFGHGVGASIWSEEWPFISADATAIAEPGMVLAFETSLADGGWPTAWARDVTDENLELAGRLAAGTVIERRLEAFFVRAETLSD